MNSPCLTANRILDPNWTLVQPQAILVLGVGRAPGKNESLASEAGEGGRKSLNSITVRTEGPLQRRRSATEVKSS